MHDKVHSPGRRSRRRHRSCPRTPVRCQRQLLRRSSSSGGAVIEQPTPTKPTPTKPTEPTEPTQDEIDQEVSDKLRAKFVDYLTNAGSTENAAANGKAEEILARALAGEFTYVHQGNGVYGWQGTDVDGGYYVAYVMRLPKLETTFGIDYMDPSAELQDYSFPFGVATGYDANYHYLAVALRAF